MNNQELIKQGRQFTKFDDDETYKSDQDLNKTQPPLVKEASGKELLALPLDFNELPLNNNIIELLYFRQSQRIFTQKTINLTELSFLLWATQGIKDIRGNNYATIRTVPCGGARHEFETYLIVKNIEGLKPGFYQYLPLLDSLELLKEETDLDDKINKALMKQTWATKANVIFLWSMIPYRAEWRYGIFAHRVAMMDVGHIGENLYLACEALGLGTCGIGAFEREFCNKLFNLDGEEEYIVYTSPVGTIATKNKELKYLSLKQKRDSESK